MSDDEGRKAQECLELRARIASGMADLRAGKGVDGLEAFAQLEDELTTHEEWIAETRRAAAEGIEQADRGELVDGDESIAQARALLDEARRKKSRD